MGTQAFGLCPGIWPGLVQPNGQRGPACTPQHTVGLEAPEVGLGGLMSLGEAAGELKLGDSCPHL